MVTGGFTEYLLGSPLFGLDLRAGAITAPGSYAHAMQFSSAVDIGRLIAHAVTNPAARNQSIYLNKPLSYAAIADAVDGVSARPFHTLPTK